MLRFSQKEGRMPRIMHTIEHISTKLREAEVALSKGQTVVQVSRSLGSPNRRMTGGGMSMPG
jgi:hypothetical protein